MTEKINVATLPEFDITSLLYNDAAISEYLLQVLNDGDSEELLRALSFIEKAKA